jgi:predicted peptidase
MYIEKTIKNLNFDKRKKYIVMGHSDGIYFAMEFAKQYPKLVKEIISLDGSWITVKLCKQRLTNWKKKGKIVKLIKIQKELDAIMNKIIKYKDKEAIQKIINHKRYEHTKRCIESKYQNIVKKHKFTIFRDYNSKIKEDINEQFNEYALIEHEIMSKLSKNYQIFWQIDAGHGLWFNKLYKEQIVNYIKCLYK